MGCIRLCQPVLPGAQELGEDSSIELEMCVRALESPARYARLCQSGAAGKLVPDAIAQSMAKGLTTGRSFAFIDQYVRLVLSCCPKHVGQSFNGLSRPLHAVCILFSKAGT